MLSIFKSNKLNINQKIISILFIFLPFLLITGPFLSDLAVSIVTIYYFFSIKSIKFDYKNKIFLLFILFYLATFLNSFNFEYYLQSLKSFGFYFRFIFFIIVITHLIKIERDILIDLYKVTLFCVIIVCASAFYEYVEIRLEYFQRLSTADLIDQFITIKNTTSQRISGIFGDEQILGSYLLKIFPIFLGTYYYVNKKKILDFKNNLIILFFIILFGITIIISGDRAPIILFSFELFLLFIFLKELRKYFFLSGIVFALIASSFLIFDPLLKERVINVTITNIQGKYNDDRPTFISKAYEGHFQAAIIIAKKYPLLGSGIKGFRNQCKNIELNDEDLLNSKSNLNSKDLGYVSQKEKFIKCTTHPHNIFLHILSETGILGISIFFILFYYVIKNLLFVGGNNSKIEKKQNNTIFKIYSIALIIVLWPLTTGGSFFNNYNTIFYCIPLILYLSELEKKLQQN